MRAWIFAAAIAAIAAPAAASDKTDIEALVTAYNKDFAAGSCAPQASIIDEFGKHAWQGATACADWLADFNADSKANGITDAVVTIGKPAQLMVNGDRAYAVYAARYIFKKKDKPVQEKGVWTFAFEKSSGGWKITAWTWSLLSSH